IVLIESGGTFMPVETERAYDLAPGQAVEAMGWPNRSRFTMILQRAEITPIEATLESGAASPDPFERALTDLSSVRQLSPERAAHSLPVDVTGVVTAIQAPYQFFFFQSGDEGIFVDALDQPIEHLSPGLQIRIRGFTARGDFAPVIKHPRIEVLGPGSLPAPQYIDAAEAPTGSYDSEWVEIEGQMRPFGLTG